MKIGIIVGTTRPGRRGAVVGRWVHEVASRHPAATAGQVSFELVDLTDYALPMLDEPTPALFGDYRHGHTRRWADKIGSFDGFVFVTAEYNHSVPGALKNAIDFLFAEWSDKAAGFVSYGVAGGVRAVEHLRQILAEVKVAAVRTQVTLSVFADFEMSDPTDPNAAHVIRPGDHQQPTLNTLLDEVISWARALQPLRTAASAEPQIAAA